MKKSRLYTAINAAIAVFLGGLMLLGTGFWLYVPSEIEVLPETGNEVLGDTWTVCPDGIAPPEGCQYFGAAGIQQAIDQTADGDTVLVKAGDYNEVEIQIGFGAHPKKTNVTIKGENKPTLKGKSAEVIIFIGGNSQGITIEGFNISHAGAHGIATGSNVSVVIRSNNIFNSANAGISIIEESRASILNNVINNNEGSGIQVASNANVEISNNLIHSNLGPGVYAENSELFARNNTVVNNHSNGIDCVSNCDLRNNISYGNNFFGIIGANESAFTNLKYNLSFGNTVANWNEPSGGQFPNWPPATNLTVDPKFVSTTDYHLQAGSPAINAGDPSILDPDGSRSDIGAYGGPASCGLDPTLPSCVAKPKDLSVSCTNGTATFKWTGDASVPKYLLRVNHEPKNAEGGINTNQCKNTAGATVGWYCPSTTTAANCLSTHGCDDRYIYVTGSLTHTVSLKAGEQYAWSVNNLVNNVEGAGAGSIDTNVFTCSGAGVTPPVTTAPSTSCKPMDVNSDGKFNISDLASFAQGYPNRTCTTNTEQPVPTCGWEDVNGDTKINIADFASFAQRYFTHHDSCAL